MKTRVCFALLALALGACTQAAEEPAPEAQPASGGATPVAEAAAPAEGAAAEAAPANGNIVGQEVTYEGDGINMKGYLAYDKSVEGKRPGVIVVHEWWGNNAYARKRADMLAGLGYTAFALDMYGDGKQAEHPGDAGKFAGAVNANMEGAKARFLAAMKVLQDNPTADATKIAAIGYCFGGGIVLNMARLGIDLKGVASFHGSLGTQNPAKKGVVKAKVLVCHGEADPFTTPEQLAAFKKEMADAGVDMKLVSYPGAKHAFTNPDATALGKKFNLPLEYNEAADEASWQELQTFLKAIFAS